MDKSTGDFLAPMERITAAELAAKFPAVASAKAAQGSLRTALGSMVLAGFTPNEIFRIAGGMIAEIQCRERV